MVGIRIMAGDGSLSLYHPIQTDSGAHPPSYSMGAGASFPDGKAAGAWSWPLTSISAEFKECVGLYIHSPNTSSWRGAQLKHRDNFTFTFTFTSVQQNSTV